MKEQGTNTKAGAGAECSAWDRATIEQFCDGDLTEVSAAELERACGTDPVLAQRVRAAREADALIVRALLTQPDSAAKEFARPAPAWRMVGAAAVLVAVIGLGWFLVRQGGAVETSRQDSIAAQGEANPAREVTGVERVASVRSIEVAAAKSSRVRVLYTVRLADATESSEAGNETGEDISGETTVDGASSEDGGTVLASTAEAEGTVEDAAATARTRLMARLDEALARGDLSASAQALAEADEQGREQMFSRLGRVVASASTASRLLEALPGDVAVELCGQWLKEGQQRPLALKHLRARAQDGAMRDRVHVAVRQLLDENPKLRSWMVSYASWAVQADPPQKAGNGAGVENIGSSTESWNA